MTFSIPGPGSLARKLSLTVLCVLAARGCASDIEHVAARVVAARDQQVVTEHPFDTRYDPASARDALVPYGTDPREEPYGR